MEKINSFKERIRENFKKNKIIFFVFLVIWIATIAITLSFFNSTIGKESIGNESYNRSVVEINKDTVITEIVNTEDNSESVSILFATYARPNIGNVFIKVVGADSNFVYADKSYDVNKIQDNAYITIKLNKNLIISNDKKIKITITSDSNKGEAIGVYYSNDKAFENSIFYIDGDSIDKADLCFKFLKNNEQLRSFSNSVIIWSIIGLTFISLLILLVNPKEELLYALIVFVFGLIMMIIIVPASPPDELSHYEVSLQVSNMMLFKDNPNQIDSVYLKYGYMYGHYNISPGYVRFIKEFGEPLRLTGNIQTIERKIDGLYLVQYIPSSIGITLGRLLNLNMITTLYLGRLTTLIFYTACIYIAIKNAASYKHLFGLLACMPMFVQIGMSISYDAFILGLSFIIISFFTKWFFSENKITIKDFVIVFLTCLAIAPAKVLYSFFAFIYLFVPTSRFGSLRNKIIMCGLIIAPGIYQLYGIMAGPLKLFFDSTFGAIESKNNTMMANDIPFNAVSDTTTIPVVPTEVFSFKYMIKHPWETLLIFARTVRYKIKYWFYGSLGRTLSGETLVLPLTITHVIVAILFASSFVKQDYVLPISRKIVMLILCVVIGLYAMIGMFVSWTDTSQEIIKDYGGIIVEGIQGRYFSQVLPYFFSIFANKKISLPKKTNQYILLSYLLVFFVIVVYVLSYTFVN